MKRVLCISMLILLSSFAAFSDIAPAKTPKAIVDRVNASVVKALADPTVRSGLSSQGAEPVGNTPEEYDRYNRSEIERWTKVARAAGVVAE